MLLLVAAQVVAFVGVAFWSWFVLGKKELSRWWLVALPPVWGVGAIMLAGNAPDPDEGAVLLGWIGGLGVLVFWCALLKTHAHANRAAANPLGTGAKAEAGAPACAAHGNVPMGMCDRCGDLVCPECSFYVFGRETHICGERASRCAGRASRESRSPISSSSRTSASSSTTASSTRAVAEDVAPCVRRASAAHERSPSRSRRKSSDAAGSDCSSAPSVFASS